MAPSTPVGTLRTIASGMSQLSYRGQEEKHHHHRKDKDGTSGAAAFS